MPSYSTDGEPGSEPPTATPKEIIPGHLTYPGAPNPRWWQLEDSVADIGAFAPDRAHFATRLMDVVLEHSNDWFTFPVAPPLAPPSAAGPKPVPISTRSSS